MERTYGHSRAIGLVLLTGVGLSFAWPVAAETGDWLAGDVFIAVGDGAYQVYDRQGEFKHFIRDEQRGFTTNCAFNPGLDKLYTANYTHTRVVVYDNAPAHPIVQTIDTRATSPGGHSGALVFDAEGSLYVGHPDGNELIHKYNEAGMLLATFNVAVDGWGTDWIDLASDLTTLFYSSEERTILRFDTATNTQLADFAELPGAGHAFALRLLPPGDGSGGLLVADESDIKRLDGAGHVVQIYDDAGQDDWFALNLDPGGTAFWAADSDTDRLYRFNIATGAIERQFTAGPGNTISGVCVKGEITAGVPQSRSFLPQTYSLSQNAPNPFNPSTQIEYHLPEAAEVSMTVYNLLGQQIRTLVQGVQQAGLNRVNWDGTDRDDRPVSSGVYLYRFVSEDRVESRRMLLLK